MRAKILLISAFLTTASYAADLSFGVKLFKDGLYSLASKTFSENIESLSPESFKKYYKYIYLSFLKSGDFKNLKEFIRYWEKNFPRFHRGELLSLKTLLGLKEGKPIEELIKKDDLTPLSIKDKVAFFKTIANFPPSSEELYYLLSIASKDIELKGAVKESGLLSLALKKATEEGNTSLADLIFEAYGRWFESPEERIQFVKYLERKKRFKDALLEAEKLYKKYPSDRARLELAKVLYLNGKYKEALKLLQNPKTEEERYLKAWCYFKLGEARKIPQLIGLNVSRPQTPEKIKVLLNFYKGKFELKELKKLYPELYLKALIFSFSTEIPEKVGSLHDLGYIYYERGLYMRALSTLEEAVQEGSEKLSMPRTLFLLGKLGSVNADVVSTVYTELMNSYQNTPYYAEAVVPAAKAYLLKGNTNLSLKLLKYAESQLKKRSDEVKKLIALAYRNSGNFRSSVKYFLSIKKKDGEVMTFLPFDLYQLGKKEAAYKLLKLYLKRKGLYPEVNEGRFIYLSKELKKVKELNKFRFSSPVTSLLAAAVSNNLKKIKELLPSLPEREKIAGALLLATALERKNPNRAMEYLTTVFNLSTDENTSQYAKQFINYLAFKSGNLEPLLFNDPKFIAYNPENSIETVDTLVSKAEDYVSVGEYGKAYGLLKLALERTSSQELRKEIVKKLVYIDLKRRNYSRALKDVKLLPLKNQSDKDLKNFLRFKIYLAMGKLVDAYSAAESVKDIKNIPKEERETFIAKLAGYYKLTGDREKALELLEKLVSSGNLSKLAYDDLINLAIFAEKEGKLKEANLLINEAMKKAKRKEQKVESLFWKASLQAKMGNTSEAILNYMKIAYEYPDVEPWASTAIYRAAQLFEEKGDLKQALKLYQKVVKLKRGTKEGEIAAERVKSLLQRIGKEE
ncbi:tetratricopeptide repeat protein [Phorcysia thermohydrogeniphila]|uniref:Tetratricopeptide repeat protein n=1 Tax=Phorcysia thermohydrogeniphila TaxID=936138 RepID=A0A4R1GKF8_9BACT|nr:tetratricopeptide repeat protein [Phorcysia thermohydrogeniphila]TCK06519.1 tetratricopeptide repeat protein [Phorcysia thermohydrogeniphila]